MRSARSFPSLPVVMTLAAGLALAALPAWGGGPALPAPVTALQDCWTTALTLDPDAERELYEFDADTDITLVWKHKILVSCSSYHTRLHVWDCVDGKPKTAGHPPVYVDSTLLGPISPIPGIPELLFADTIPAGTLPAGRYDWAILVECDDTNGAVATDGDFDDICGGNLGLLPVFDGPVIFGPEPEPARALDGDPGGSPPGRGPGEDRSTRPWCFEVLPEPPPFDLCPPDECATFVPCNVTGNCFCFELYDAPGTGGCLADGSCGADCSANGDLDCAGGEVCITNTCCGYPSCTPALCGSPVQSPFFGPTAASNPFFSRPPER